MVDRFVFSVQQYVDGPTLTQAEFEHPSEIVELVAQVADGLAYAHSRGVIHRDLKPGNIMVSSAGVPLIADFGLAIHESVQRRLRGQRCGSPAYMSPEQVRGLTHQMDGRSDIWSLGVVLYEKLAGVRPFGGDDVEEIYEEITSRNEKPLRMVRQDLDEELQRICLKCLTKSIRDRYNSAAELAVDLRHWLQCQHEWESRAYVPLMPRGLKSFGQADSEAYLPLVPGQRDRFGVPDSIGFWKQRLEAGQGKSEMALCAVIGPSGSGKSSLVHAGLLPRLDSRLVKTIEIEATAENTEASLLARVAELEPKLDEKMTLPQVFDGIKSNLWDWETPRCLIVIDQFEQWLAANPVHEKTELAQALRHCNGQRLCCLLIVRDEFSQPTSRLLSGLDFNWNESTNIQRVDLFDKPHATRVLFQLGRALGRLPDSEQDLQPTQIAFLERVFEELAEEDRVVPVHLTMFTEMFKTRNWDERELDSIGGVAGVGHRFLESHFGQENQSAETREFGKYAAPLLEYLLPHNSAGIRGSAKSQSELIRVTELDSNPGLFKKLIDFLEQKLKLIVAEEHDSETVQSGGKRYRLTHDYLVSAIREWRGIEMRKSMVGRARLQLKDIAALNHSDAKPRIAPNHGQWLLWNFLIPRKFLTAHEKRIMAFSRRRFMNRLILWGTIASLLILAASWGFGSYNRSQKTMGLASDVLRLDIEQVPNAIKRLDPYRESVDQKFEAISNGESSNPNEVFRSNLYLMSYHDDRVPAVIKYLVQSSSSVRELSAALQVARDAEIDFEDLRYGKLIEQTIARQDESDSHRLRAILLRNGTGKQSPIDNGLGTLIGHAIGNEPATTHSAWIDLFEGDSAALSPVFEKMFAASDGVKLAQPLSQAMRKYMDTETCLREFAKVLERGNDAQFSAVFSQQFKSRDSEFLKQKLLAAAAIQEEPEVLGNIATAMLLLDDDRLFLECLAGEKGQAARSHAIVKAMEPRISLQISKKLYLENRDGDKFVRQGLLMILSRYASDLYLQEQDWLRSEAQRVVLEDGFSGCYAAGEKILKNLGDIDLLLDLRMQRRKNRQRFGNVFIGHRNIPMVIIEPDEEHGASHPIAISMYEMSNRDIAPDTTSFDRLEYPYIIKKLSEIVEVCKRFNDDENSFGYRPATVKDWNLINSKINGVEFLGGEGNLLADYFACHFGNSNDAEVGQVGAFLPNPLGFFDLYGNAIEVNLVSPRIERQIRDLKLRNPRWRVFGGESRTRPIKYSVDESSSALSAKPYDAAMRLVKSLASNE